MDKSIEKFLKYLRDLERQITTTAIKLYTEGPMDEELWAKLELKLVEIKNFTKLLTAKKDYQEDHGEVFADFGCLSQFLEESKLNLRDYYNLILFFIKKNIQSGLLGTDKASVLLIDLKSLPFLTSNKEVVKLIEDLIDRDAVGKFLVRNINYMTDIEVEAYELIESCTIDLDPYRESTIILRDRFVEKEEVSEEDILLIEQTLLSMGVSDKCVQAFMLFVNKKMAKKPVVVSASTVKPESKGPKLITEKEFKSMKRVIKSSFDVYKRTLLRSLSFDETIYIAYLMHRLGYSEMDIENLFRASIAPNYLNIWGISDFLNNPEKFRFYMEEEDYNSVLEYLAEADNDPLSSSFWVKEASKLINQAAEMFNHKFDYEMSLAKTYQEKGKKE